ncbi:MAG: rod shape-determining protein MreC [bacterium]|nr:rod shape-determining protein MreC [bacterium]
MAIISLLVLLLDKTHLLNPIKNLAEKIIVMPVSYVFSGTAQGIGDNFRILTFWKSGEERIKNLESKNWELESVKAKRSELLNENEILRKQLNVLPAKQIEKVLTNVLGISDFMVLDAGENQKVKIGDVVIFMDYYIGRVVKTTTNRSFVQLATNSDSSVNVKIGTVRGIATGQFNTSIILDKVSQDESILKDDMVLTTGDGNVNVPNLLVGKIGEIKSQDTDIYKKAQIIPLFETKNLNLVFIVLNEN